MMFANVVMSVGLAYHQSVQIELIQYANDVPSPADSST